MKSLPLKHIHFYFLLTRLDEAVKIAEVKHLINIVGTNYDSG